MKKITHNVPVKLFGSASNSMGEIKIKVEIYHPASPSQVMMITIPAAVVQEDLKQLQLNFNFLGHGSPNSSKSSRTRSSSTSSTPTSPNLSNKKKLTDISKSLEEESPRASPDLTKKHRNPRRHRNDLIARIVRKNMVEFVHTTNFDTLSTHLYQVELLSHVDMVELEGIKSSIGKKNFFYMLLLDTKGVDAYNKLFECLRNETHHCGHRDLVSIIESGLRQSDRDAL